MMSEVLFEDTKIKPIAAVQLILNSQPDEFLSKDDFLFFCDKQNTVYKYRCIYVTLKLSSFIYSYTLSVIGTLCILIYIIRHTLFMHFIKDT